MRSLNQRSQSYRPISQLCVPFKILERLIYVCVETIIDPLFPQEQAGLRHGRSAVDQVTLLTQDIQDSFSAKKKAGAAFIDLGEYLQTWKLKLSTTKMVSAVFHLNNKEDKHELKVIFNNETLPFCSVTKYLGVTLDRSLTYCRHLGSLRKKLTSRVALLRRLAGSGWGASAPVWCRSAQPASLTPPSTTPGEL